MYRDDPIMHRDDPIMQTDDAIMQDDLRPSCPDVPLPVQTGHPSFYLRRGVFA
jgi:hypothetical protein